MITAYIDVARFHFYVLCLHVQGLFVFLCSGVIPAYFNMKIAWVFLVFLICVAAKRKGRKSCCKSKWIHHRSLFDKFHSLHPSSYRKIQCRTGEFNVKFHAKNRYRQAENFFFNRIAIKVNPITGRNQTFCIFLERKPPLFQHRGEMPHMLQSSAKKEKLKVQNTESLKKKIL